MIASPVAMATVVVGCTKTVRRARLSARVLRAEMAVGRLAVATMVLFVFAAGLWMLSGGPAPGLFTTGAIDRFALIAMVGCLLVAIQSLGRACRIPLSGLTTETAPGVAHMVGPPGEADFSVLLCRSARAFERA